MNIQNWGILVGVIVSVLLALVPWMLMVHAKLAVLVAHVTRLTATVDRLIETEQARCGPVAEDHIQLAELHCRVDHQQEQMERFGQLLQEYGG